jgi:hypothetical protein
MVARTASSRAGSGRDEAGEHCFFVRYHSHEMTYHIKLVLIAAFCGERIQAQNI